MKYKGKEDLPQLGVINLSGLTRTDDSGKIVPCYCVLFDGGQDCCWVSQGIIVIDDFFAKCFILQNFFFLRRFGAPSWWCCYQSLANWFAF